MKYPRTLHLPNSPGFSCDDKRLKTIDHFIGKEVIYTEKIDGECTGMTQSTIHARSEESIHHPSRSWVKQLYHQISYKIPKNIQIFGENIYAEHSIFYDKLTSFFYVFGIVNLDLNIFLSVDDTISFCKDLELEYVPILYRGIFNPNFKLPNKSAFGDTIEGYVVKTTNSFHIVDMNMNVAKWVRKEHVTTDKHWSTNWKPNKRI